MEYHTDMESKTVDTFDNFLKPTTSYNFSQIDDLQNDEKLDEYFQMLQFELDNTKMIDSRKQEVKS
jgi:hypothetical protein